MRFGLHFGLRQRDTSDVMYIVRRAAQHTVKGMKPTILLVGCIVLACGRLSAQTNVWQPSPGHKQVPIWPGAVPDAEPVPGPEAVLSRTEWVVADKPFVFVVNVSQPTMTVYSPKGTNTGVAVIVFPGGGYNALAIDLEGTEICDWLTSKGITAVLLKYRVPLRKVGPYGESPLALQDAQRTVGLVRSHATEWQIDPHKIGVIGFSAGGHMVAAISTHFETRSYPAVDAADKESCRPNFAIACYPGHLWNEDKGFMLNPNVPVTMNTPPTFLLHAEDDPVDNVNHSLVYYIALKNAKVPVEIHFYAQGGHAFGLRPTKSPITEWPWLVETWLGTIGMTSKKG
jgi:acetyl esterase/lipase